MPRNKDQKRLIRTRMQKTGESYTAARAVVVARASRKGSHDTQSSPAQPPHLPSSHSKSREEDAPKSAAPRSRWPELAGMADDAVRKKTGRTWAEWVDLLDEAGAYRMSHRDIARYVSANHEEIGGWWAQSVTVGYERIRGLRDVGQHRDGAYDANKSRTFAVDVSTLYGMFKDARRRRKWLPDGVTRVRTSIEDKSIRADWSDGTRVNFYFVPKGTSRSSVAVQHAKLSSKADVEKTKAFWHERLDVLRDLLD